MFVNKIMIYSVTCNCFCSFGNALCHLLSTSIFTDLFDCHIFLGSASTPRQLIAERNFKWTWTLRISLPKRRWQTSLNRVQVRVCISREIQNLTMSSRGVWLLINNDLIVDEDYVTDTCYHNCTVLFAASYILYSFYSDCWWHASFVILKVIMVIFWLYELNIYCDKL